MNLILITLDGLRRDRLRLCTQLAKYGGSGIIFPNMFTAAPYTTSAMHAIFSGMYPSKNGVNSYYNMFKFRKEHCKTLTSYLKENGYYTAASVINPNIIPNKDFNKIRKHEVEENLADEHSKIIKVASGHDNFFVYLQYSSIHDQIVINVAKKYSDFDEEYFNNKIENQKRYDSYVISCDNYIGKIMEFLIRENLLVNTVVIFHSDHGISIGERKGEKMYGSFVYDYTIKSFCYMIVPGNKSVKFNYQCSTIDIMPTILDILEIAIDTDFDKIQGQTLWNYVKGKENKDRLIFSETGGLFGPWPSRDEHNVFCVRYHNKKIIYNKVPDTWEFYDINYDHDEVNNLVFNKKYAAIVSKYKIMLMNRLRDNGIDIPLQL